MVRQKNQKVRLQARAGWLVLLAFILLAVGACRGQTAQQAQGVQIDLRLSPDRPAVGPTTIAVQLQDATGRPIEGAKVDVEGTMTHAGMQPVIARAREVGNGRYLVDNFEFGMAGDWVLIVQAELPSGALAERTFKVPVSVDKKAPHDHRRGTGG